MRQKARPKIISERIKNTNKEDVFTGKRKEKRSPQDEIIIVGPSENWRAKKTKQSTQPGNQLKMDCKQPLSSIRKNLMWSIDRKTVINLLFNAFSELMNEGTDGSA